MSHLTTPHGSATRNVLLSSETASWSSGSQAHSSGGANGSWAEGLALGWLGGRLKLQGVGEFGLGVCRGAEARSRGPAEGGHHTWGQG